MGAAPFEDLEILTRPYGSAGTAATNPHPLVAERLETDNARERVSSARGTPSDDGSTPVEDFRA